MALKKVSDSSKLKRKVMRATIEVKKQIVKHKSGMCVFNLVVNFPMPKSTIQKIQNNKYVIKAAD